MHWKENPVDIDAWVIDAGSLCSLAISSSSALKQAAKPRGTWGERTEK